MHRHERALHHLLGHPGVPDSSSRWPAASALLVMRQVQPGDRTIGAPAAARRHPASPAGPPAARPGPPGHAFAGRTASSTAQLPAGPSGHRATARRSSTAPRPAAAQSNSPPGRDSSPQCPRGRARRPPGAQDSAARHEEPDPPICPAPAPSDDRFRCVPELGVSYGVGRPGRWARSWHAWRTGTPLPGWRRRGCRRPPRTGRTARSRRPATRPPHQDQAGPGSNSRHGGLLRPAPRTGDCVFPRPPDGRCIPGRNRRFSRSPSRGSGVSPAGPAPVQRVRRDADEHRAGGRYGCDESAGQRSWVNVDKRRAPASGLCRCVRASYMGPRRAAV